MAIIEDLVVSEYGSFVGLRGRRIYLQIADNKPQEIPLMHLRSVQITTRSASISASAIGACCDAGIPIHYIDPVDGHYATLLSPNLTTVNTSRRAQIESLHTQVGVHIAHQIALGKIKSQIANLRYLSRRLNDELIDLFDAAILDLTDGIAALEQLQATTIDDVRMMVMGIEGQKARIYWAALAHLMPDEYQWPGRTGRHATDPINSLLNYGYGILYGEVQNALVIAGLEPYIGLLHTDRPGKPSLTLDFIEEFRAPIVDRTVIGLLKRQFLVEIDDNGRMTRETRKRYAEHILSRLHAQGMYERKRYELRSIIQMQARRLAATFRGEVEYCAYTGG